MMTFLLARRAPASPTMDRPRPAPEDRARAAALVARYGRAPLDYFKTSPDKSYYLSASGDSVIAYRVAWSVAVALGDPVGPAGEREALIGSFLGFCADNGWATAFHQVLPDLLPVYQARGLHVLKIGEVALVDLDRFAARTSRRRSFHRPRLRLAARGYRVAIERPPHPASVLDEAEEVSRQWLSLPGRRERGFALGRFDRGYLALHPLGVVRDRAGRLVAFVNQVPGVVPRLATVDLMRHRRDAPGGVMDYLFGELMLLLHRQGYRRFSLGLAPLAGVGTGRGRSLEEWAVHQIYEHGGAVFSFKGLWRYKAKFDPVWEERFLAYENGQRGLVRTALALARITRPPSRSGAT
jgi:phosphatidylglycerol lysyltransferase